MFESIWQDIRFAVRNLRKNAGITSVAVLSLALGIGANTAIFSILDAVMLRYLPVKNPEELLQVSIGKNNTFTNPIWEQLRDNQDLFSNAFAWSTDRFNVASGGEAQFVEGLWASGGFFSTLGVDAVMGRTFTPADDKRGCTATAVISYGLWQKRYGGSPDVLEKSIPLDGHKFQIVGVTPRSFYGVDVGRNFDVVIPICTDPILRGEGSSLDHRSFWWLNVMGLPKPNWNLTQAEARLKSLSPGIFQATFPPNYPPDGRAEYLKSIFTAKTAGTGTSDLRGKYSDSLWMLMAIVGVVLLIACTNVANLLLGQAAARQREIAVRLAMGASRARLIRQLLTESVLLSLLGATGGVLFAGWGSRLLIGFLSKTNNSIFLDLPLDLRILGFTAGVALLTGILFGLVPAFRGTQVAPNSALKESGRGMTESRSGFGFKKILVVSQVALSLLLLFGAGLLVRSFRNLATLDPGFRPDNVLLVSMDFRNAHVPPARRLAVYQDVLERLRAIPGTLAASRSDLTPISGQMWNGGIEAKGFQPKSRRDAMAYFNRVSPGYFKTLGTPLLAGRDFSPHDTETSRRVAVINETMARKFFPDGNPVGKTFAMKGPGDKSDDGAEVIGVVKDAKYGDLRGDVPATAFLTSAQDDGPRLSTTFELRSAGNIAMLIPGVKEAARAVSPDIALQFKSFSVQVAESLIQERLMATLSGFFSGVALLLAAIGLYGVMSYSVVRRRNEIGIRMALGAEQWSVLWLVLREVALMIGAGVIVGGAAALATTRLVSKMFYGLKPDDPLTLFAAAMALITVAAVAGYLRRGGLQG